MLVDFSVKKNGQPTFAAPILMQNENAQPSLRPTSCQAESALIIT